MSDKVLLPEFPDVAERLQKGLQEALHPVDLKQFEVAPGRWELPCVIRINLDELNLAEPVIEKGW